MDQLRRLDHIKQGQFTATVTEDEEAMPPRFMTNIKDAEVFVAEGEPAMFECRVEPKHDLNLSVRWYRNDEELVRTIASNTHLRPYNHDYLGVRRPAANKPRVGRTAPFPHRPAGTATWPCTSSTPTRRMKAGGRRSD
jgi:hypothetical protein